MIIYFSYIVLLLLLTGTFGLVTIEHGQIPVLLMSITFEVPAEAINNIFSNGVDTRSVFQVSMQVWRTRYLPSLRLEL
ncbi:hypothetical protein FRX31_017262 [Thalictrum thalictroides]|uniref:Uncharacterized protein n=1 Tax=Thalictrum thalictroides TaxID=46969 RepID=A0A7J6W979_THATH|nr:hypothetical protein FRX31_017262 [Thalictrum thalictroides]